MNKILVLLFALVLAFGCFQTEQPPENLSTQEPQPPPYTPPPVVEQPPQPTALELANQSALDFALSSSTYSYDGFGLTLYNYSQQNDSFTFVYLYNSQYSGFGNRSIYFLEQALSTHSLVINVKGTQVTYAVLDGVYDELNDDWIDVAKKFDNTPSDIETVKQIALDFVKHSDYFKKTASAGTEPRTSNYSVNKISNTLYEVTVYVPTSSDGQYTDMTRVLVDNYVPYFPNSNLQRYWVEIYLDPNADYSQIITQLPNPKCPPGQLIATGTKMKFCYPPSSTNGMPCSSSSSCIRGACVRTSMGEFGTPTKCFDYPYGCKYWVAEQNKAAQLFCLT
ncbi:Uncharacterised protein [Candidatus Bilamarchaeum dharawalense]|uniref:Uncharacterized protein n=1 Tax=Candidatus Bilamarchaeum dharawalense TaxID=2885759 RepID=A0A5E4LVZ9_9ARCH|nr:Uncharacterised protein [Candidatus Bilamarchaeum dharawalense]